MENVSRYSAALIFPRNTVRVLILTLWILGRVLGSLKPPSNNSAASRT